MKICAMKTPVPLERIRYRLLKSADGQITRRKPAAIQQIIRQMKLIMILLTLALVQAGATGYSQKVTVREKDASVEVIFRSIEKQTGFVFFYNSEDLQNTRISINLKGVTLQEALDRCFAQLPLTYKVIGNTIAIKKKEKITPQHPESVNTLPAISSPTAYPQQNISRTVEEIPSSFRTLYQRISGKVTDEAGEPLPGVSILVKGTQQGTTTNAEGIFTLESPEANAVLVFSFVGYISQEVLADGRKSLDIVLKADNKALEEVIVVGYGTQKKVTATGSVVSVKGAEIVKSPVTNVSNALVGRLAGLTSLQRSGEPGNDGSTIRIRGLNTLGNNNALIVVDGIPGRSLERIDANSIESITVLKDASAAIYGSQAANGVILITTKRGEPGKPEISLNFNQGFNQPTRIPKMADAFEYATMLNEIDIYRNQNPRYSDDQLAKFRNGTDPWSYPNTDWFKEVLKPWSAQSNMNTSMSGGFENFRYYLSLGSKSQDGYYYNSGTKYKQYDFRSNIDGKVSKNVGVRFDVYGRMEDRNFSARNAGAIFRMLMRGKPIYPAYWPDGTPGPDLEYGDNPAVVSTDATGYDRDKRYVLNSNLRVDIRIPWVNGLSLTGNASFDKNFSFRKRFETPWYLYSWDGKTYDANNQPVLVKGKKGFDDPRLTESMEDNQNTLLNGLINYERVFNGHGVKMTVGVESYQGKGDRFSAYRRYFISTVLDEMFAGGDKDRTNNGSGYQNARLNYFGRINYDYNEKILAEFVWRRDGSYIFPKEGRFGFFPGLSLGYRISEEEFWKSNLGIIENLKLRASWGQTGNDRIDEWQYLSSYSFNPNGYSYIFGNGQENKLLVESRIPNRNVTWEVANQSNIGFEASLLKNRLSVEFDYFDNKRSQILWQRNASVPGTTGLTLPRENIGKVTNKGYEFSVSYRDQVGKFRYSLSANGGYSRNKITYWDESPGRPDYQQSTGKPIPSNPANADGDLYYVSLGIFKDKAAVDAYPHWTGARPGDVIFKDVNNDGIINGNDRIRVDKTTIPRFTGGLSANLGYGSFDLAVLFQGAFGAVRYISTESGEIGNFLKDFYDNRWTAERPDASQPRTFNSNNEYWQNYNSTLFLHNSDYVRLKNIELGYSLPAGVAEKIGVRNLRFYINGFNLITLSPQLKDFDPETDQSSTQVYPVQKVVNGGITLTF